MKNYFLIIFLLLLCVTAICQTSNTPTPEYDYALLRIIVGEENQVYSLDRNNPSYILQYSNSGMEIMLKDTLKLGNENVNFTEARFKCFQYLNHQGYELVTSTCYAFNASIGLKKKYEYVFKRQKQVGGK